MTIKLLCASMLIIGATFAQNATVLNFAQTKIVIKQGNLIEQPVQAIVNAANTTLIGSAGVAKVIQDAAGKNLVNFLRQMAETNGIRCNVGDAKITPSFDLEDKGINYIIHTVGPNLAIPVEKRNKEKLISNAYKNSLQIAVDNNIKSLAFPALSAAIFGYDIKQSAPIVIQTVTNFLKANPNKLDEIYFVFYNNSEAQILYTNLFRAELTK